jgi:hypothetical protein
MLTFHSDPISDNQPTHLSPEPEEKHQLRLGFEFRPIQLNLAVKLAHVNTSSTAQLIYLYLVDLRNGYKSGICTFPFTFRQIQKAFGTKIDEEGKQVPTFTLRTIKRAITELQHSGLIQLMRTTKDAGQRDEKLTFYLPVKGLDEMGGKHPAGTCSAPAATTSPADDKKQESQTKEADNPAPVTCQKNLNHDDKNLVTPCKNFVNDDKNFASSTPVTPVVAQDPQPVLDSCCETFIVDPLPIAPQNIEMLSLAWNESHEYEEGEGEAFDKYFDKAIRATMAQHAVDENVAVQALIRAFHRTKRNHAGHHPYDYPTAYTGDPDHSESNATPRGKKILRGAIHAVKAGESFSFNKQPLRSSNDSTITEKPTAETVERRDSDKSSAPPAQPAPPKQAEPQTPLATVRRNLAGRAAMLKAGIISPLSRDDVLSHAQPGLDEFDDIPGDDVILGVWNELAPDIDTKVDTPLEQSEPVPDATTSPAVDAFSELVAIQAKIVGLDEMRRSGALSVDEVAEVTQEIAALKRQKAKVQRNSDKCSTSLDQDADKGVYDASATTGASVSSDEGSSRIAKTIKSSLMADKEYSDEQIVMIVQRQERSIDSAAILEVWHNWSDWSGYLQGVVNQRIQSGSLMPDEVLEARCYAARLRDWERKNQQWEAVV